MVQCNCGYGYGRDLIGVEENETKIVFWLCDDNSEKDSGLVAA